jgi:HD-like signal output (HDOD) protein
MPQRPCVLFVDDEPHLLAGLRRGLHAQGVRWCVHFAESGDRALEILATEPCDAVVSDMRMPGMDGAALLTRVQQLYPGAVRIVLSGEADRDAVLVAAAATHQFLAKPCELDTIVAVVDRALAVRQTLADPSLQQLIGGISHLPTLPAVYHELTSAMGRADCTVDTVASILAKDVATCVEVLKLTNSAFFGIPRRIETVAQAVSMLGLDTIQALVVTGTAFRAGSDVPGFEPAVLQRQALQRAVTIRRIGAGEGWSPSEITSVGLASMLLDVGALVLAGGRSEEFARFTTAVRQDPALRADPATRVQAERTHFGCSVPEASAYLLGLWGFSQRVVHLVAGQPADAASVGVTPVELAVTWVNHRVRAPDPTPLPAFEEALGPERLPRWATICDDVLSIDDADLEPVA